jgi:hypothetical protein
MCDEYEQPVPDVTDKDVKRIAIRDFGEDNISKVLSILDEYNKDYNEPSARVCLAILKLANGDLDQLIVKTNMAIEDFRDVLAQAEYPRYSNEIRFDDVDPEVAKQIINDDWKHYCSWLELE